MRHGISDKRSGTATTENEIGLPRMDSFQNPCSESFLCPGSATHRAPFPAPLRYLPLEENLWQIVLTVGVVPPGARNIPTVYRPRESGHSRCSRFCKRGVSCLLPDRVKTGSEYGRKEPRGPLLFYYAAYVRDFLLINSGDGNMPDRKPCRDRIAPVI